VAEAAYAEPKGKSKKAEDKTEKLRRRYDKLKGTTERQNCESHWQELAEHISPRKQDFVGMRTAGEKKMQKVYDPTGIQANEMLAAGLHGMATNPASRWFSLRLVEDKLEEVTDDNGEAVDTHEMPEVQKYLSSVEQIMWARIYQPGSNFTTALHECYLDLGCFGTSVMFVGQRANGGLMFECRPLAECVIDENAEGRVDTVFRCTEYTVRQMHQLSSILNKDGGWELSPSTLDKIRAEQWTDKVKVIHGVYPREEREYEKKDNKNMPFASCYFEHETAHLLSESGFPEFPYLVARWSKYAGEIYGRSPGMSALPDIKMLQAMTLAKIQLMQKAANPPMWLRDDGVVGQTRTVPGGINYWRGNPSDGVMLQPVSMQGLQFLAEDLKAIREQILRAFYADLMRMTDRADMTATEVVQRTSEQMRLFGPLIGRLESEKLGPLVERIFGILSRLGLLPQPPEVLGEREMTVEYVSPIATAQKQQSANGIVQVMQLLMMFGPEVAAQIAGKNLDVDKLFSWAWDLFNCDPDLLKDEDGMAAEAQRAATAEGLQMGMPAADIAAKGGKAIKDIADAGAKQGIDVMALLGRGQQAVQQDPQLQSQVQGLMNGELPAQA
jgi:hypothetical protein